MRARLAASAWLCFVAALPANAALAQDASALSDRLIFGHLDPSTNTFTADAPATEILAAADANISGTIRIEITFRIGANIPQNVTFDSGALVSVTGGRHRGSIRGDAVVTRNGNVGRAVVTLPYLFLATPASKMQVSVFVGANQTAGQFTQLIRTIPLPAQGATTVLKINASL